MSKKVKNVEKGSHSDEERSKLMKDEKNNIFWIFSGKYEKTSKKVKNVKKGSDIDEKGQIR